MINPKGLGEACVDRLFTSLGSGATDADPVGGARYDESNPHVIFFLV
jgi:hypothetical protein